MKKFTLYILTAFGLMGLATSCNDFGDVNNEVAGEVRLYR